MMRAALLTFVLLFAGIAGEAAAQSSCEAIVERLNAARAVGTPDSFAQIWTDANDAGSGCDERAKFCIGQSIALGQLDAAYRAADGGAALDELVELAEAGLAYGRPWQLEAALGDLYLDQGRTGGGGPTYSRASLHYQQALIGIGEPPACGNERRPAAEQTAELYDHLSAALLLADPLEVATTKCAPCQWLFLAGVAGFTPNVRPLPITFPKDSADPTVEGAAAIAALLQCIKAGGQERIVLSGHTDPSGSVEYNLRLSERRLQKVAAALKAGGFAGEIVTEARGEEEPFKTEAGFFPAEDELRLSRRIELRDVSGTEFAACS